MQEYISCILIKRFALGWTNEYAQQFGSRIIKNKMSLDRVIRMTGLTEQKARELMGFVRSKPAEVEEPKGSITVNDRYVYNPDTDTYITYLNSVPKPIVLSGDVHREIIRAYSNFDGQPASLNEIARSVKLPRNWLVKYLRAHEITHDREPFSNEEILSRTDEDLVEESLQIRRMALHKAMESAKWKDIQSDATKWRKWETHAKALFSSLEERPSLEIEPLDLDLPDRPYCCVLGLTDFHWGKYSDPLENGSAYNRELAKKNLFSCTEEIFTRVARFGRPDKIFIPIGSDFFHVDNDDATTTSGTRQDVDGTPAEMLVTGCKLMEDWIRSVAQIAPVELVLMSGNHDRMLGLSLLLYLEACFRNDSRVTASLERTPRIYKSYGTNLIGFVHSDGVKSTKDLSGLMAQEASDVWGSCPHRTIYTGHLHFEKTEADTAYGVVRRQIPSLAGTDRWHNLNGFVGSPRSLPVYLHDYEDGLIAVLHAPAKD